MAPTIYRSYLGQALVAPSLLFFLNDPKRFWWLGILAIIGSVLIIDDMVYYLSDGKYCMLCKIVPPTV